MQFSGYRQRFCGGRHQILSFVNLALMCGFAIWKTVEFPMLPIPISHSQEAAVLTVTNHSTSTGEGGAENPQILDTHVVKVLNEFAFLYAIIEIFAGSYLVYIVDRRSKGNYSKFEEEKKMWSVFQFFSIISFLLANKNLFPATNYLDTVQVVSNFIVFFFITVWKVSIWIIFSSSKNSEIKI